MDDRYFLYRIPEHLECYIDCGERKGSAMLPYEREDFRKVFPRGKFYLEKNGDTYVVANAAKGGVVKIFNTSQRKLLLSDCGVIGKTNEGRVLTSQWIDPASTFTPKENGFSVSGALHAVPAHKVFTPLRMILFRLLLLLFGWHSGLAYAIKGLIRKLLMLRSGRAECFFYRNVELHRDSVRILDILKCTGRTQFSALRLGGEFAVRYVPQSRYFQSCELHTNATPLTPDQLRILNDDGKIQIERHVDLTTGALVTPTVVPVLKGTMGLEYSEGRKSQRALTYRLRRRSEEVIAAIRTHAQGSPRDLLDVGPAEGKVLSRIQDAFPELRCIGLEYSQELIDACTDSRLHMIQGDALTPPFPDASFDIVTATAFIEHVADPQKLLKEIHRVLRPGGIVILTTPQPVFERIAVAIGHLPHEDHQETMTLMKLAEYLRKSDFGVIELRKFMVSPWGLPREQGIEGAMRKLGFSFLFLNQLAVGRKS
jgi:ubiquinone/menaquinone biosynthesis C-methylase UbiE